MARRFSSQPCQEKPDIVEPGTYYHIYNHANGSENLFRQPENYRYFLRQWHKYISPVAVSLAYCLMPNHFHFLIRVREEAELAAFFANKKNNNNHLSKGSKPLERLRLGLERLDYNKQISRQFSHLFNSYAQAYNKMYNRRGSLFIPNFKKKAVASEAYLSTVIAYIHHNPVRHGFTDAPGSWPHSSYPIIVEDKPSFIDKAFLIEWFGGQAAFVDYHRQAGPGVQEPDQPFI